MSLLGSVGIVIKSDYDLENRDFGVLIESI